MYILGISGGFRWGIADAAAALIRDNEILCCIEEERLTRKKFGIHCLAEKSIIYCLKKAGIDFKDIDAVVSHGITYKEETSINELKDFFKYKFNHIPKIVRYYHHDLHAASSFYVSGFKKALVITYDMSGDDECTTLSIGEGRKLKSFLRIKTPNSLGIYYNAITRYLGYDNGDEYKIMGLSAYGKDSFNLDLLLDVSKSIYSLNPEIKNLNSVSSMQQAPINLDFFYNHLEFPHRTGNRKINTQHMNFATSAQRQFERAVLNLLEYGLKETGCYNVCIAGGCGLNCVANGIMLREKNLKNIFVTPASSDAGLALGAALTYGIENGFSYKRLKTSQLGISYNNEEIKNDLKLLKIKYKHINDPAKTGALLLSQGKIIGWFQGASEYGPRALGSRSILATPLNSNIKDKINRLVKFRETYLPFAPSVLEEKGGVYFENFYPSPFMNLVFKVKTPDLIPAVTHVDGTARVHSVTNEADPLYYKLIKSFGDSTGVYVVLNTSFNYKGQPIVETPKEAIYTFYGTGLDALVIGNFLIEK